MKKRKAESRPVVRPGAVGWILEGAALLVLWVLVFDRKKGDKL